ncbi:hypothetical protein GCM10027398_38700 [Azotobacter salinestris]
MPEAGWLAQVAVVRRLSSRGRTDLFMGMDVTRRREGVPGLDPTGGLPLRVKVFHMLLIV